jgi:probable O-glycosylation ligase (exosortase A-associated)
MAYTSLLLFFVLEYIRPGSYFPGLLPLHLNLIVPVVAVIAALFGGRKPGVSEARDLNDRLIVTILILLAISVPTANVRFAAQPLFEAVIGFAAMYWVITKEITDVSRIKGVFRIIVLVHLAIMVFSPEMLYDSNSRTHGIKSGSFLGDGNDFALSLNIAVPFALFGMFQAKKGIHRFLSLIGLMFLIVGIVASQSRGGTIALASVGFYYWIRSGKKLGMAVVAGAVVIAIMMLAPPEYFGRMSSIADHSDGSAQGRITSWKLAWKLALQNPVLGIGAGNTPYMGRQNAHSVYFQILGELGFPGATALIAIIIWNIVANRRLLKEVRPGPEGEGQRQLLTSLSASLIAFAVAGAFLSAAYYPHAYILAGLLSAGRRIVRDENRVVATAELSAPLRRREITYHWALAPSANAKRLH